MSYYNIALHTNAFLNQIIFRYKCDMYKQI